MFFFFSFSQWSEITDHDKVEKILNEPEMTPNKIRFKGQMNQNFDLFLF